MFRYGRDEPMMAGYLALWRFRKAGVCPAGLLVSNAVMTLHPGSFGPTTSRCPTPSTSSLSARRLFADSLYGETDPRDVDRVGLLCSEYAEEMFSFLPWLSSSHRRAHPATISHASWKPCVIAKAAAACLQHLWC
jgi:hypothetical protein